VLSDQKDENGKKKPHTYSYDDEKSELLLEYLDEIVTNHNQTNDDPKLDDARNNPWMKDGDKLPKTISVSKEFNRGERYDFSTLQDSIKTIYEMAIQQDQKNKKDYQEVQKKAAALLAKLEVEMIEAKKAKSEKFYK